MKLNLNMFCGLVMDLDVFFLKLPHQTLSTCSRLGASQKSQP